MQLAQWIGAAILLAIGFILALIRQGYKTSKADAQIIDLTAKINKNKALIIPQQKSADDAVKEYQNALSKLDPNFHNDDGDDSGGAGSIH